MLDLVGGDRLARLRAETRQGTLRNQTPAALFPLLQARLKFFRPGDHERVDVWQHVALQKRPVVRAILFDVRVYRKFAVNEFGHSTNHERFYDRCAIAAKGCVRRVVR